MLMAPVNMCRRKTATHTESEEGMVTVETAFSIAVLGAIVVLVLHLMAAVFLFLHLQDVTREVARAWSVTGDSAYCQTLASQIAPESTVTIADHPTSDDATTITVHRPLPGLISWIGIPLEYSLHVVREPTIW